MKVEHVQIAFTESSFIFHNLAKLQAKLGHEVSIISYKKTVDNGCRDNVIIKECSGRAFNFLREVLFKNRGVLHFHNVQFIFLLFPFLLFRMVPRKKVITIHTSKNNYSFLNLLAFYLCLLFFDNIIFCSNVSFRSFYIPRFFYKKVKVVNNGIDFDEILNYRKNRQKDSVKKIISIGRAIPLKNHIYTLRILKRIQSYDWRFTIIGSGVELNEIKSYVIDNNLEGKVEFLDGLSREKVYETLSNNDFFISSSTLEGLPMAPLEAMSLGLKCFVSNISAHKVFVVDGVTYLFPLDDVEKSASIVEKQLFSYANVPVSDEFIKSNFSSKVMIEHYNRVYTS